MLMLLNLTQQQINFKKYDKWNFPLNGADAITLNDNKIILLEGEVYIDDVFHVLIKV